MWPGTNRITNHSTENKMPARKPKPDEKPQSERFIETARKIGASENPADFEKVFERIVVSKDNVTPSVPRPHRTGKPPSS